MMDIDAMVEANAAAEWEKKSEPVDERLTKASKALEQAMTRLDEAEDFIVHAAEDADGMPAEDQILSFREDLTRIWLQLCDLKNLLRKGAA